MFNNVEEIPGAIEEFSVLSPDLEACAHGGGQWRALLLCSTRTDPSTPPSVAHVSNLLSHDHLWHRLQTSSVKNLCSFGPCGEAPGTETVPSWLGQPEQHSWAPPSLPPGTRCLPQVRAAQWPSPSAVLPVALAHTTICTQEKHLNYSPREQF